jgi:Ni/Fe-hydrogenase 1 B-type cytochrome subunit
MANGENVKHPARFRLLHVLILSSILLLIGTGFYIHYPFFDNGWGFLMAMCRGVHFFAAAVLTISVVVRVIMMFVGKQRDWDSFIPTIKDFILLPRVIGHYAHLCDMPATSKKYNPMQMMAYGTVFLLALFQIISGLAMLYPDGWLSWFNYGIFGTEVNTRIAHYIINWVFLIFIVIHLYLGIRDAFDEMKDMHMLPDSSEDK